MPDQISVSEFIAETSEDYNSSTTSSFTTGLHNCRNTVTLLEETVKRSPDLMQFCSAFTSQPFCALLGPLTLCFIRTVSFHPQRFVRQQATVSSLADEETGAQKVEVTCQRSRD
ncbi:unnamed protein product [Rangifer tarandus platyrhynchus]|uniref:Uncharacterized protein n=1 Tax=Rangifer tarandus platyrhynchus TaxID=3082113 RepID=A0ABN8XKZ6_RANTA|nr:unnamed protein product [Rangifer tarandus platyrhynchus]